MDCNKIVALIANGVDEYEAESYLTYGGNASPGNVDAFFTTKSWAGSRISFNAFCDRGTPNIGEIMGVSISRKAGYGGIETGTYPNAPEYNYQRERGEEYPEQSVNFWILNTRSGPDFWLEGVTPRAEVTPLATTLPGPQNQNFKAWIGDRAAIEQWVRLNRLLIDDYSSWEGPAGSGGWSKTYQYQGSRIYCTFPYDALLKYPFCGGLVLGEEAKGPQFINLCENDLGVCGDCCDCCTIAEKLLTQLKTHPLYK